ncbi:hypothetical protein SAMN05414139_04520 [Burkholderia sp. D7]|nr:hypothetical protein SAMN05414139_04520 [Burkholderia sp. D7]
MTSVLCIVFLSGLAGGVLLMDVIHQLSARRGK